MLIGRIRSLETRTLDIETEHRADLLTAVPAQTPEGWEVVDIRRKLIRKKGGVKEIEAEDMAALEAKVPDGWQLLSVRFV